MLFSYGTMAQEKTVSKNTVLAPEVQSSKIRICAPSKSAFINPLYVMDGKITDSIHFFKINPNDIESLKVMHSPEAKLIYGDQGANGAIIITRKK